MWVAQRETALRAFCNAVLNVFWSALSFLPVCVFCYQYMERRWLYTFTALGMMSYAVPVSAFRRIELSARPGVYRRLRVHWVNHFVQHGTLVHKVLRWRDPGYRRVRSRTAALRLMHATYHQERFHWAMFIFFLLTGVYAAVHGHTGWASLILLTNILYNLYPVWLQQYIRIRMRPRRVR